MGIIQAVFDKQMGHVMAFWMFYPFIALLTILPSLFWRHTERIPPLCQSILYSIWATLETVHLLAQKYSWCSWHSSLSWFMWMQGLQAISLLLLLSATATRNSSAFGVVFFVLPLTFIVTVVGFM